MGIPSHVQVGVEVGVEDSGQVRLQGLGLGGAVPCWMLRVVPGPPAKFSSLPLLCFFWSWPRAQSLDPCLLICMNLAKWLSCSVPVSHLKRQVLS